jgi:purine-nucleoside phosphorylase
MTPAAPRLTLHHPDRERILASLARHGVDAIDAAVLAGSGLAGVAAQLEVERELPYAAIDGFPPTIIPGHPGKLVVGRMGGKRTAVFAGRFHLYEGASGAQVTLPVQLAAGLGARLMALTSSVGAINPAYEPGDLLLVADHINLTQPNPLFAMARDANPFAPGEATPFVDLAGLYRSDLYEPLRRALEPLDVRLHLGVLAAMPGPNYETPAEVRLLRTLGADAVCMSTVPEALYARYAGLEVAALALVVNKGDDGSRRERLTHADVLARAAAGAPGLAAAVAEAIRIA